MLKTTWRSIKRIFIIGFISSTLYLVLCKWVMPPITLTQFGSWISGDGLKRNYISWEEISPNVKLAAIASEDQLFPDHNGFDWNANWRRHSVWSARHTHISGFALDGLRRARSRRRQSFHKNTSCSQ